MADAEQSRDAFFSGTDNYLKCALLAQQELFQLGVNLLQREMDAGQRIVGSRDLAQAFAACAELMRGTVEDLSESTARLFKEMSVSGPKIVEGTAESVREAPPPATEPAKAGEAARGPVRRARKRGQTAENEATAKARQVTQTEEKAQAPIAEETKPPVGKDE